MWEDYNGMQWSIWRGHGELENEYKEQRSFEAVEEMGHCFQTKKGQKQARPLGWL